MLILEFHYFLVSCDVARVCNILATTAEMINTEVGISLFGKCHESLEKDCYICLTVRGFGYGKA
jgi:hypothetical protein